LLQLSRKDFNQYSGMIRKLPQIDYKHRKDNHLFSKRSIYRTYQLIKNYEG